MTGSLPFVLRNRSSQPETSGNMFINFAPGAGEGGFLPCSCPGGTSGRRKNKRLSATDIQLNLPLFAEGRSLRKKGVLTARLECPAAPGLRCGRLRPARPKGRQICPCHLTVRLNSHVCRRRAFVFLRPLMPQGHWLCRTPHAGGALTFLHDQKSKQKSRRECDSPLLPPVGTGNRTFPEQQPLPNKRIAGRTDRDI